MKETPIAATETSHSATLDKYIESVASVNRYTAYNYRIRLAHFASFVNQKYNLTLDEQIKQLQLNNSNSDNAAVDVYDLLSSYVAFLQNKENVPSPLSTKLWISTIRNFLESFDVEISPRKFKLKVRMPKVIRQSKEALAKEDIINILNACSEIKLKTYLMFLAATGCRASEAISIRLCDLDFSDKPTMPSKVFIRGEYTKTRTDRYVFLTREFVEQLNKWLDFKYRTRRVSYIDKRTGKSVTEARSPDRTKRMNDLVFASSITKEHHRLSIRDIYSTLLTMFDKTLDRMAGIYSEYEDGPDNTDYRRRKITLHSFRRFVKSTISDLGYSDYSEWFIGHSGSTYYRKSEKEKAELFQKIESNLVYLDYVILERRGADIQSKIDILERENIALRQRDSIATTSIQDLSDQLLRLTKEFDEMKISQLWIR